MDKFTSQKSCITLYFKYISVSQHPYQHGVLPHFLISANQIGYKLYLVTILIYSYLILNEIEHLPCVGKSIVFIFLLATFAWYSPIFLLNCWLFSYWSIKALYILRKWISDSCPLKSPLFTSSHQLLLQKSPFSLSLLPSLLLLSHIVSYISCLYEQERRMAVRLARKYTFDYPVSSYFT